MEKMQSCRDVQRDVPKSDLRASHFFYLGETMKNVVYTPFFDLKGCSRTVDSLAQRIFVSVFSKEELFWAFVEIL